MAINLRGTSQILTGSVSLAKLADTAGAVILGTTGAGTPAELAAGTARTVMGIDSNDSVSFGGISTTGGGTELSVTTNALIGGTLGITGTTTTAAINASGTIASSVAGTGLNITNNGLIGGTLGVTGTSTLGTVTTGGLTASGQIAITVAGTGLDVTNDATIGGDLTVTGDLTVNGDTVTVSTSQIQVEDSILQMAKANNSTDTLDIGFVGLYDSTGSLDLYCGLFRDETDNKFKLFVDSQEDLSTASTVNTGATGYATATLVANLEGSVTGTCSDISNHAISGLSDVSTSSPTVGQLLLWDNTNSVWENASFASNDISFAAYGEAGTLNLDLNPGSTAGLQYISNGSDMVKARKHSEFFTVTSGQETSDTITLASDVITLLEDQTEAYINGLRYRHGASQEFVIDGTNKDEVDFDDGILVENDTVEIVYWKVVT